MTEVLVWLTVAYLAVLVLAVAAALVMIAVLLWRTSSLLGDVERSLAEVERGTRPVEPLIRDLRERLDPLLSNMRHGRLQAGASVEDSGPVRVIR